MKENYFVRFQKQARDNSAKGPLPRIVVAADKRHFASETSGAPFVPWGFNYDHDRDGRLLEDYWHDQWSVVATHFRQMRELGANVVRIHLQLGRFMDSPDTPRQTSLDQLTRLLQLAETEGLYLDLTGLGCYHKADVPAWYDQLSEADRWQVQARFWQAVAETCRHSSAVFCYDLMNEPVVGGGRRQEGDWLGPAFAGKHFVQFITLDQRDRPRPEIARNWIHRLTSAIREFDRQTLITVGLVDWSLDRPGLTSGFIPQQVTDDLDFVSVHLYPHAGQIPQALETLAGFSVNKPVLIEETFPLKCSPEELAEFIEQSQPHAAGWIGFYWGQTPQELRDTPTIAAALTHGWLQLFQKQAPKFHAK
ncbi:MAG: cellulase family glycosylhydrolase [Planctomycetes bacterium]|nr:cellulase family glycosylhydrolase [Planctomycetota bacterium]